MAYKFIIMPNDHFFEVAATILATNRPLSAIYFTYADMICFVSFSPLLAVYPGFLLF